ncbi:MAG TPA: hypothetical protein VEW46_19795 [Pyrinomonadaceae bacterium]|nr:hypothetical protein [Pyrinomonadaceae bacterium]
MPVVFDEVEAAVDHVPEERSEQNEAESSTEAMLPTRIVDEFRKMQQREARLRAD